MSIIEVLEAHVQSARNSRCSCGEWRPDHSKGDIFYGRQHRVHVAEMLEDLWYSDMR